MQARERRPPLRSSAWRAELLALADVLPTGHVARGALAAGFEAPAPEAAPPEALPVTPATARAPRAARTSAAPPGKAPTETLPVPFWRFTQMTWRDDEPPPPPPSGHVATRGLTDDDWRSPGHSVLAVPNAAPLTPWRRLWPALQSMLRATRPGRDPDVSALVARWGRGESVTHIPRVARRAWAERASLWIDRSDRLLPFAHDQDLVRSRLEGLFAKGQLDVHVVLDDAVVPAPYRRDPNTPVLALSDLGAYGPPSLTARWTHVAHDLRRDGVRVAALLPAPRSRWPGAARVWSPVLWERAPCAHVRPVGDVAAFWAARAEALLTLASAAVLVQPGLLRALRHLLPPLAADASTEADVWNHPAVRDVAASGLRLQPDAALTALKRLAAGEADLRRAALAAVRRWHGGLPRELLRREVLAWVATLPDDGSVTEPERDDAVGFALRLAESTTGRDERPRAAEELRRFTRTVLAPLPDAVYRRWPELLRARAVAYRGWRDVRFPEGVDANAVFAAVEPEGALVRWALRQVGGALVLRAADDDAWRAPEDTGGSPIAWMHSTRASMLVRRGDLRQEPLREGLTLPLRAGEGVTLDTGRCAVTVEASGREPWMRALGRDRFGLWAEAREGGMRFRWIPPGRFVMGSPPGEAGRGDDETPHEVTLTRGYWLGETPVTQAQWEAVGGRRHPSYFKSPERPVEQVSWDEARDYAKAIGGRLPTEAEWEHACRAGSTAATWVGDLTIIAQNHAPELDAIAWYGGNSGKDFDLPDGWDSSGWPGKQYAHSKAGTRAVRGKAPNPFGLYDMLGNVWEWCSDLYSEYTAAAVTDPVGAAAGAAAGTDRVVRGSSWRLPASYVRAGQRLASPPDAHDLVLGFRVARGQT